jgi:drug/metabolite transporter (DMT)-like permease
VKPVRSLPLAENTIPVISLLKLTRRMAQIKSKVADYSGFVLLSVIWGLAFVAIKQADTELSPVNLSLIRWFITSVVFLILLPIIGKPKIKFERKDVPRLLVVAIANVAGYHIFLNSAETSISAGLSSLLIALGPVFMVVLSVILLDERASSKVVLALLLAVSGTFVLSYGSFNPSDLSSVVGPVEAVLAAFCYAVFTVVGKPLVQKYGSAPTTILAGLVGTIMIIPLVSGNFVTQVEGLTQLGWISVLYRGILSSALGYLLYYGLVSRRAVSRLSIQLYLIPVVSVVGGVLLLNESVTVLIIIGGAMMLFAVALTTQK